MRHVKPLPLPDNLIVLGKPFRLRYVLMMSLIISFCAALISFFPASNSTPSYQDNILVSQKVLSVPKVASEVSDEEEKNVDVSTVSNSGTEVSFKSSEEEESVLVILPQVKPSSFKKRVKLASGDTLSTFLDKQGIGGADAYAIIEAFRTVYNPRDMKAGEPFVFDMVRDVDTGKVKLVSLEYLPSIVETVMIMPNAEGGYVAQKDKKKLVRKQMASVVDVESSLYASAARVGLPDPVIMDVIYVYSWKIDFQRDIRSGDQIRVLYEAEFTEDGEPTNQYNILFASMTVKNQDIDIYRYKTKDGLVDFFLPDAKSVRQGLLRTPIEFGRVSSGFGLRKHPVLGYNKMHKGVDFAAPRGTKIYAAADGVIDKKYYSSSYGNYIRIRHTGGIKTAYAHMKGFARGLSLGDRVKQGQTIGYVGTTGRSTGPHLHYEVLKNGRQVNPKSVNLPTQNELKGQEKEQFIRQMSSYKSAFFNLVEDRANDFMAQSSD